ncbi:MAG: trypsin-like peptidase domain-containing protein [Akkermansiaceae bacterium]
MKKSTKLIGTFFTSLSLATLPIWAQGPDAEEEIKVAPNVKNFKELQKLDRQIVALSEQAQPATVCLVAKNGRGSGSGVVVSEDGLILTAAHVTSSMPGGVVVIFPDGTRKTGEILGADYDRDAAMVQITDEGKFPFVPTGESKGLKRNQWTVALGHSGGFDPMRKPPVRLGRVLANNNFVVTDTAVVGGDSGGPLFDVEGRVIGIHSNIGITLSENRHVPIDVFRNQWEKLKGGKLSGRRFNNTPEPVQSPDRPMLGVQLGDGEGGVMVTEVVPNSPAEKAGLKGGDLITKLNGKKVSEPSDLIQLVGKRKAGQEVSFVYKRAGEEKSGKARLVKLQDMMEPKEAPVKPKEPKKKKPLPKKEEQKKAAPKEAKKKGDKLPSLEELLKDAAKNGGRLEITPKLIEKMGGMEKLMEELRKRGGQIAPGGMDGGVDEFFASSLKALEPVMKRNPGVTAMVTIDGKPVALGTVISVNGRILTKNAETDEGKLAVRLGGQNYEAKVLKRFPERDLALLKIEANNLRPVRFQVEEPALGSILTASGIKNEPLGIGLLSVPGRAMSQVGFIGIQAGEGEGGVLIAQLVPDGAAEQAGLKENDIITSLNGEKVEDPISFGGVIRGRKAGEEVNVGYLREGKPAELKVTLKERKMLDSVRNDPRMKRSLGRLSEKTGGYPDVIQHDIPLPPELCGGPLFNLKGKCIGVNVSRAGRTKTYAIPADEIVELLNMKAAPKPEPKVVKKRAPSKKETLEAIKAIRESMKQIESRLELLEESVR